MDIGVVHTVVKDVNELLNGTEDIDELLAIWGEVNGGMKKLRDVDERIKTKVKMFLKERKWERYVDDKTKISVALSVQKRQVIDKEQVKMMLSEAQYAQVLNTTTFEKMMIVTPETRKEMNKYVKKQKR